MPLQFVPRPPACAPFGSSAFFEYGYLPRLAPGIVFTVLFFIIALVQLFYMIKYRAWWMFFFVTGAGLDCLGWIGRLASHYCPYSNTLNVMQVATLIMGPAWTQAGVYCAMWVLIRCLGGAVSPIPPAWYLWISVVADTVALSLQATGGGLAGSAADANESPQTGTTIMVVGIIAQLVCGIVFFVFMSVVFWRGRTAIVGNCNTRLVALAMAVSTAMMILRGFYRSVELVQGWTGYLILREEYLWGLDAVPMVVAMGILALFSPGALLATFRQQQRQSELLRSIPRENDSDPESVEKMDPAVHHRSEPDVALDHKFDVQHGHHTEK